MEQTIEMIDFKHMGNHSTAVSIGIITSDALGSGMHVDIRFPSHGRGIRKHHSETKTDKAAGIG